MRKKFGLLIEFCLGAGAVLLIASCIFYFVTHPGGPGELGKEVPDPGAEIERRYESLLREKDALEAEMEDFGEEGVTWLTPEDPAAGAYACGFTAYFAVISGDARARVRIEMPGSGDVSADRLLVIADGEEEEIPMREIEEGPAGTDDESTARVLILPAETCLPLLERAAGSERVELRFPGGGDSHEAFLAERQIQNLGKVLRLRTVYKEIWALEELRRMR